MKCFFCTSSKGFYAFFDDKDSVVCIKTEPFKARFCGFFATACALQPVGLPFVKAQNGKTNQYDKKLLSFFKCATFSHLLSFCDKLTQIKIFVL